MLLMEIELPANKRKKEKRRENEQTKEQCSIFSNEPLCYFTMGALRKAVNFNARPPYNNGSRGDVEPK